MDERERERETVGAMRLVVFCMAAVLTVIVVGLWLLLR